MTAGQKIIDGSYYAAAHVESVLSHAVHQIADDCRRWGVEVAHITSPISVSADEIRRATHAATYEEALAWALATAEERVRSGLAAAITTELQRARLRISSAIIYEHPGTVLCLPDLPAGDGAAWPLIEAVCVAVRVVDPRATRLSIAEG